jgi:hypothetical protein
MIIKKQVARKIIISTITFITVIIFSPFIDSCRPELNFGEMVICGDVEADTFKPAGINENFDVNTERIFAVIEVSGVKTRDIWKFVWMNESTDEIVVESTGKYSADEKGYAGGYLSNCLTPGEGEGLIGEPGNYKVYFYHNGELMKSADFVIEIPGMEITEVLLCREIDNENKPVEVTENFYPDDVIHTLVGLNCRLKGESLQIKWFKNGGELLGEEEITMKDNYYMPGYIIFKISNDKPWPAGDYKIELYHNGILNSSYYFNIIKEDIPDATFYMENIYKNEEYNFSILYPDDWDYREGGDSKSFEVNFIPMSDTINTAINIRVLKKGYYPLPEEYQSFSDNILSEIVEHDEDLEVRNEKITGEINGLHYTKIGYYYDLEDESGWDVEIFFIEENEMLYLLIKLSNIYYREFSDKLCGIMLNSLSIE